jgi:SAM-dependent methyltransferase
MAGLALRVDASVLACPVCGGGINTAVDNVNCDSCALVYPVVDGRPVLLRPDNKLFQIGDYVDARTKPFGRSRWAKYVPGITADLAAKRVLNVLRQTLDRLGPARILVVGGGCQREWLDDQLRHHVKHEIIYSDIDTAADVDMFCDGHDLPCKSGQFDAVITTAVLEHVIYPEKVVLEITRVLKTGGLVYSEVPFIQQVHEGAYDFTRYTLSGHRRLFNKFNELDAGMTAGPGSALAWSIESFVLSFFQSAKIRLVATGISRVFCSPLKYCDRFLSSRPAAMDGACGTYFFGRKCETVRSDADIIAAYVGAKYLAHS